MERAYAAYFQRNPNYEHVARLSCDCFQYNIPMSTVNTVSKAGRTYAIFVHSGVPIEGTRFFTQNEDLFQVGMFERPMGYSVRPHQHTEQDVQIHTFAEFLYIERGKVRVTVFDDAWEVLAEEDMEAGSFLLFLSGGHALTVLEPARILEVKQGPYPGDGDAKIFRDAP